MAKEEEQKAKPQHAEKKQAGSIVRIAGKDINGDLDIPSALAQIKGIGFNLSNALTLGIEQLYKIDRKTKIGSLEEDQISQIESLLKDPRQAKVPNYILNRRGDRETGQDIHLVGTDLIVRVKQDIDYDIRNLTWRGFRHRYGQKVRGQKTRSTGRTGETVGVTKAKVEAAAKPAPATGPGKPAPAGGAAGGAAPAAAPAEKPAAPAGDAKK